MRYTSMLAVIVGMILGGAVAARAQDDAVPLPGIVERSIELTILHKNTDQPLGGVDLQISTDRGRDNKTTDRNGRCAVSLPVAGWQYVTIIARTEGFVPMRLYWTKTVPDQYTLKMVPATSVGGMVQDEAGQPIVGASVRLLVAEENTERTPESFVLGDVPSKTGADGKWRCDTVPPGAKRILLRLSHPEFISDEMYGMTTVPIESLRKLDAVVTMKKGVELTGQVLNKDGKPLSGATVSQGSDRFGSDYPQTRTNADGHFRFASARPGLIVLTFQAAGHAPALRQIQVDKDTKPLEVRLEAASVLKGRLVDPDGRPVAGAFVAADTWQGHRSLMWRDTTDAAGRFTWLEAPADEVLIDLGKQGYMSVRNFKAIASDKEIVITMNRPLVVRGAVADAETNQPIRQFRIVRGISWGQQRPDPYWELPGVLGGDGKYEISFTEPRDGHLVRIEADGYLPAISPVYRNDGGTQAFDARMKKGTPIVATVLRPDGKPAEGADVGLCLPGQTLYLRNGVIDRSVGRSVVVRTGADGRFELPPQVGNWSLTIVHDAGMLQVAPQALVQSSQLRLQPWCGVEGVARVGLKPAANQDMSLSYDRPYRDDARAYFEYHAITDEQGRFRFDRVAPGEVVIGIYHTTPMGGGRSMGQMTQSVWAELQPGQVHKVQVGGTGRAVVGRIQLPTKEQAPRGWIAALCGMTAVTPDPPYPANFGALPQQQRQAWYEQWGQTPEGKAFRKQRRHVPLKLAPDGSFRVDDVPPGKYKLTIALVEPGTDRRPYGAGISAASKEVIVPDVQDGQVGEAVDLGLLESQPTNK